MADLPSTADTVIVGAGVMGCSIAFHLAQRGVPAVVLDRGAICSGNTRKSGALVRMHYQNEPEARMAFAALPYFQNWRDMVGYDCGFTATGAAAMVGPENVERLRRNVEMLRAVGVNTRVVGAEELKELQPFINVEGVGAAAYEPESGYADPVATTQSFARRAIELGATIREGVRVTALRIEAGRVRGVRTDAGEIACERVVLAAGPWTTGLLREAGVEIGVEPVRAEIAFVKRPAAVASGHFVFLDFVSGSYFRQTSDGLSLLGTGTARRPLPYTEIDSYDEGSTGAAVSLIRERIRERAPVLGDAPFARGHAGLYDMSPDEKAILDRVPGVDGAYMAVGFSGTGFKKSPAVGACMAELIVEGAAKTADIVPFRFARFAEGARLRGEHEYAAAPAMH
jgi:glycine/D-amino acid oxidase-like deaminating enzyme